MRKLERDEADKYFELIPKDQAQFFLIYATGWSSWLRQNLN
jgi:hypothetical protein